MIKSFDYAQAYYWQIELIEPEDPDDDHYVILHGEDGQNVGPLTVALAQFWIDQFTSPSRRQSIANQRGD